MGYRTGTKWTSQTPWGARQRLIGKSWIVWRAIPENKITASTSESGPDIRYQAIILLSSTSSTSKQDAAMMSRMTSFLAFLCLLVLQASTLAMAQDASLEEVADTQQNRKLLLSNMCYCKSCTREVLKTKTAEGTYTCKQRMAWLMGDKGETEYDACRQVGGLEFPDECGDCNPDTCDMGNVSVGVCTRRVIDMCKCKRIQSKAVSSEVVRYSWRLTDTLLGILFLSLP